MVAHVGSGDVLFGRTRQAIFNLVFLRPDESFYLREIVRRTGAGVGAVQRELKLLTQCGILQRDGHGFFRANIHSAIYDPLKQLVIRSSGIGERLRRALQPVSSQIAAAFVFGSFARDEPNATSDVDIAVISTDDNLTIDNIISALKHEQEQIGRELNPFVLTPADWQVKLAGGNAFVRRINDAEKIFLIGDDGELKRLAQKRVAQKPFAKPAGNKRSARPGRARPAKRKGKGP